MSGIEDPGFLGRGWSFPPRFDALSGRLIPVAAEEDIVESLRVLFLTRPGERVMQPRYGCTLQDLVFEPMDPETEAAIELAISRAILFCEPRITLERVVVQHRRLARGAADDPARVPGPGDQHPQQRGVSVLPRRGDAALRADRRLVNLG